MSQDKNESIIVKKVIKKGGGHHGGAWKVAYSDFVTSMMALFIVLWVLAQDKPVIQAVAGYFQNPVAYDAKIKKLKNGLSSSTELPKKKPAASPKILEKENLQKMGKDIVKELKKEKEFKALINKMEVQIVKEGLRIELIDSKKGLFFRVGTNKLKKKPEKLMERIGGLISKLPNNVIVEGHTDSRPYKGKGLGYTNFELSTERANSARRALIKGGLNSKKIKEVRGYADRILKDKKHPLSAINRRISIILEYLNKDKK